MTQEWQGERQEATLARIDERTISMQLAQENMKQDMRRLQNTVETMGDALKLEIEKELKQLRDDTVTKAEFWPVRAIVYGGAALVLTSTLGGLLVLVLK